MRRISSLVAASLSLSSGLAFGQADPTHSAASAWLQGNTLVQNPAARITAGQVPGFGGTPESFDATSTGYYYVVPSEQRQSKGPMPLLLALDLRGDQDEPTPRTGMSMSFMVRPWLYANDAVFIGLNHGAEDSKEVALQRSLDALHDAMACWNIDPSRVYVGANDFGARNAVALVHHLPPGFFAGALLSSNAYWGTFDDWNWHASAYSLFTGEDDSSYDETWDAFERLSALGKEPTLYIAPGLANHAPILSQAQQLIRELTTPRAVGGSTSSGPRIVVFPTLGDESHAVSGGPPPLLETIAELLDLEAAQRPMKIHRARISGATVEERVLVTHPSPIDFGSLPAFKSEVPSSYDPLRDATYFLYAPPTLPAEGVTLLVAVVYGNQGGQDFFQYLEEHVRERGLLYIGANDIHWRDRAFAERGQRVLDTLHDVQQKYDIDKVLFYGYCGATGLATAVAHALPGVFEGGFLGGGAYPPGDTRIITTLQVGRGIYCYTGERDWARQDVESAHRMMIEAGIPATLSSAPGLGHALPSRAEIRRALSWLLD